MWTWANLTRVFLFKTRHTLGGSHYFVSVFWSQHQKASQGAQLFCFVLTNLNVSGLGEGRSIKKGHIIGGFYQHGYA